MQHHFPILHLGRWSHAIAAAAAATSPKELAIQFSAGAEALIAPDCTYVGIYHRDERSVTIDTAGIDRWNREYDSHLFRFDPFFKRFMDTRVDFVLPLAAFDTAAFRRSQYWRNFYEPSDSVDEITAVFNLDSRTAAYVTFIRKSGKARFSETELGTVEAVGEATRVVLCRLWHLWLQQDAQRVAELRLTALSVRECQIANLLLRGDSAKAISRRLAISAGTVRNHIKKIYPKLGVHSQVELLALGRVGSAGAFAGLLTSDNACPQSILSAQDGGVVRVDDE